MKILIISQYFYPEQFLINEIAPELVKRGHNVSVICGLPNYPMGRIYDGYKDSYKKNDSINGVNVIRCWQLSRGSSSLKLMLNYLSFTISATYRALTLKETFDVIFCYQMSPITLAIPGLFYKKKYKTPSLIYCMDLWPESIISRQIKKDSIIYDCVRWLSQKIYNGYNRIAISSLSFQHYLNKINRVPSSKIFYLPQHANCEMLNLNLSSQDNGIADFMFAGNIGLIQDLDIIVQAAQILGNRNDYKIHIVGDGSYMKQLRQLVNDYNLSQIFVFHGFQKVEDMPYFYKMADALLITLNGKSAIGGTIPSKLQTYMTTGKVIFGAINGDSQDIIREADCGEYVNAGDYKGLSKLMLNYINNKDYYDHKGENGRKYFKEHFGLNIFISKLVRELSNLVNNKAK